MNEQQTQAVKELVGAVSDAYHSAYGEWGRSNFHPAARQRKDVDYYRDILAQAVQAFGPEILPNGGEA